MAQNKKVGLAPLAGFTESAFRRLTREFGADFTWTELTSANFVLVSDLKHPQFHIFEEERPLRFQLHGSEVETLVKAAEKVLEKLRPEGLDLNAGCPAKKIIKAGAGAALLADLPRLFEIAKTLREIAHAHKCDFSVKFRLGFTEDRLEEIAEILLKAGVDLLVLHPRTAKEGFSGRARWERVGDLVKMVAGKAKVYGSGDIKSFSDIGRFLRQTGAQGALIGRAALERPWIFHEWKKGYEIKPSPRQRFEILKRLESYLEIYRQGDEILKSLKLWAPRLLKGLPHKRKLLPLALKASEREEFWRILHHLCGLADANYR